MNIINIFKKQAGILRQNLVTIIGLAISLSAVVLSVAYLVFENSYDSFWPDAERIYLLKTEVSFESGRQVVSNSTSHLVKEYLDLHSPDIESVCRTRKIEDFVRTDSLSYKQDIVFADSEYLDVFGITCLSGSATAFGEPDRALVSESFAEKTTGVDAAIGTIITYNKRTYKIAGLIKDLPANSTQVFDILLPMRNFVIDNDPGRFFLAVNTYVKVRDADDGPVPVAGVATDYYRSRGNSNTMCFPFPLKSVYSSGGQEKADSKAAFILAAAFVLAMSVINFSTRFAARTENNLKGLAIRKSFGASMNRLLSIIFSDALIIALSSLLLGLIICDIVIEPFRNMIGIDLLILGKGLLLTPLIILLLILAVTLIVSIPASVRFSKMTVVKLLSSNTDKSGNLLSVRKAPLVFQFIVSLTLIAYLVIQASQIRYLADFDNGTSTEGMMIITLSRNLMMSYDRFAEELESVPGVVSVSGKAQPFGSHYGADIRLPEWDDDTKLEAFGYCVQDGFFDVMDIDLVAGVSFDGDPGRDSSKVIIDLYTAGLLGLDNPVGSRIRDDFIDCEIIGVAENTSLMPLNVERKPVIYNQVKRYSSELILKYMGSFSNIAGPIESKLKAFDPEYNIEYQSWDDRLSGYYSGERNNFRIVICLTVLALLLCLSGVYSIVSYRIEAERKNISIKKLMGASLANLNIDFSRELFFLILVSALVSFPLTLLLIIRWLSNFTSRIALGPAPFLLSFAVVTLLSVFLVFVKQTIIARINPIESLRAE